MDEIIKELKKTFGFRARTTTKYGDEIRDLVIHNNDRADFLWILKTNHIDYTHWKLNSHDVGYQFTFPEIKEKILSEVISD